MICFGVANACAAGIAGSLAKIAGRIPVMVGVMIFHISLIIWMKQWTPIQDDYLTYCSMAALWGLADGIWLVQVNGMLYVKFILKIKSLN